MPLHVGASDFYIPPSGERAWRYCTHRHFTLCIHPTIPRHINRLLQLQHLTTAQPPKDAAGSDRHFRIRAMSKRKRNNGGQAKALKKQATGLKHTEAPPKTDHTAEIASIHAVVAPEDVEIAVETLEALAEHPGVIKSKACKDLRTAVFAFKQACTTGVNAIGTFIISSHVVAAKKSCRGDEPHGKDIGSTYGRQVYRCSRFASGNEDQERDTDSRCTL